MMMMMINTTVNKTTISWRTKEEEEYDAMREKRTEKNVE